MIWTYTLLALSVSLLWLSGGPSAPPIRRYLWLWVWLASLVAALTCGVVRPLGLLGIAGFAAAVCVFSIERRNNTQRMTVSAIILILAAGLMLHRIPGFQNPRVINAVRFSEDAIPFTLYLNYDKTLVGLFLLAGCGPLIARGKEWRAMMVVATPWAAAVIALSMAVSLAMGYVRFNLKFPAQSGLWLGVNLFFTCTAEEALFRGFIQEGLQKSLAAFAGGRWIALGVASLLFGFVHWAGGLPYVLLAILAGLGYGWIYQATRRIEASILAHFALNSLHFFAFTYPALARISGA